MSMGTTSSSVRQSHEDLSASASELEADGWEKGSIADDTRLEELVETYEEIGYQVKLIPVPTGDDACNECMKRDPDRFRVIYIRRSSLKTEEAREGA